MDLLDKIETELELSKSDSLKEKIETELELSKSDSLKEKIETELELSKSDSLKVFYFIQTREARILQAVTANLNQS
jgi:hypothetical protein